MKKLLLDVDTGIDDAIGIILAAKRADVVGITTVNGNTSLDYATANTLKVLNLIGRTDIPVVRGADRPLLREPHFEVSVHGNDGIGGALKEMDAGEPASGFAPDFIIEMAQKHERELTLVLTAPLTNMALAIRKEPRLRDWVKEVVIMGGAVRVPGNITPTAEYNMYIDPEAAKIVLQSGLPITLVGLDVTEQTLLTDVEIGRMQGSPEGEFVKDSTGQYMKRYKEITGIHACAMHDPLAVGVALDRSFVRTGRLHVDVETNSDLCDGQTVADFSNWTGKQPNLDVCLEADSGRFIEYLVETMKM
ncbi:nucleoside hydrolase [Edaphobacillus lindanitolerans]|uniref:Purine nucleosidase n=1 Tax=Edaphobacillus lindanitolerans TaxID=550447 RepID=A0A1U7PI56_9BACI|nr:nucleoside hydrolase [Edaphobacillus lindanitolerans]SIT71720.1 purine nucleosidase [Edaphobacillus lindanitolerans]